MFWQNTLKHGFGVHWILDGAQRHKSHYEHKRHLLVPCSNRIPNHMLHRLGARASLVDGTEGVIRRWACYPPPPPTCILIQEHDSGANINSFAKPIVYVRSEAMVPLANAGTAPA